MPRGGARKGAGRPKTGRTTKVIRVPENFPDPQTIVDIQEILKGYNEEFKRNPERKKMARWQKLGNLLEEIKELDSKFLKE